MPFTVSHVAAVIPFHGRTLLPFAALAAGSVSPDIPYYFPDAYAVSAMTHSFRGIFTLSLLVIGVAVWAVWRWATPALYDMAPRIIRERWRPPRLVKSDWVMVPAAVMLGAATHVGLDGFSHTGGFAVSCFPILVALWPSLIVMFPGYYWIQLVTSAIA